VAGINPTRATSYFSLWLLRRPDARQSFKALLAIFRNGREGRFAGNARLQASASERRGDLGHMTIDKLSF
jgi:hypothetical protein